MGSSFVKHAGSLLQLHSLLPVEKLNKLSIHRGKILAQFRGEYWDTAESQILSLGMFTALAVKNEKPHVFATGGNEMLAIS